MWAVYPVEPRAWRDGSGVRKAGLGDDDGEGTSTASTIDSDGHAEGTFCETSGECDVAAAPGSGTSRLPLSLTLAFPVGRTKLYATELSQAKKPQEMIAPVAIIPKSADATGWGCGVSLTDFATEEMDGVSFFSGTCLSFGFGRCFSSCQLLYILLVLFAQVFHP